ncbi:FKBP-type peptidyl-prolyl cis-trans isomerase [Nocardia brasiliensis]|uniref:FKBP-type peptidyl-prolyl cis-trans isomerase n=1 Tax=Nocardia brasiliensis TaxID=37326 RepID=UPI001895736B|nr:FKBP-type peptidyl-prolyl cis-trans isomerase [Nocardia brasiliensis]MBF6126804.1 FKBP-type peptidyl-prolyl cis-trans isomerase [Nocardia brasiliensis]MBF6547824.1 FKBP-type peptidyl-prolyl cis-trans isomerase [Nocardia brasiliensis]
MQTLGRIIAIGTMTAAACTLVACGSDDKSSPAPSTTSAARAAATTAAAGPTQSKGRECTADDITVSGDFGAAPTITIPDDCDPPKQLITKDLNPGSGPGAEPGQQLTMNYALITWSNKQKKDSSFDRGKPFQLTLGAGQVIQGWDQGLVGVQQGARRLLIVPPDLGYGAGGRGIAPNETLVFVTDAVSIGK